MLRFLLIFSLILLPLPALAADLNQLGSNGLPVTLEADQLSYDKESGRYQANGNVQLKQGTLELRSPTLWWNQGSGDVEASGGAQLSSPDEELTGSRVFYNLQQGTGTIEDGQIFLREQNLHVSGKTIERRGSSDYRIKDGTFTTCNGEVPSWKFGADQLDVTLGGFARARNVVFYLKDIPSFYLPYLIFPTKTERESGLLVPQVGYSERRGMQFDGAYYQVLGQNQDATFYLDYLSEMGFGEGVEYRYIFGRQNRGEALAYYIDVDQEKPRYALKWQHDGALPGRVRMVVAAEYVNNRDYFADFGDVAGEYNKDKVQSIFFLSRNWGKNNLVGQLKYTKDLEVEDPTTLQQFPRVSFEVTRQRLGVTPFYYALSSEYTNFVREQGEEGQRLSLRPSFSASLNLWEQIAVTPEIGFRERAYWGLSGESSSRQSGVFDFSTRVSTRLQRIYAAPFASMERLRHILEPELVYRYVPDEHQSQLPSFDSLDRIEAANLLEYALVQRFTGRFVGEDGIPSYRDLLTLRLSQSYDLDPQAGQQNFSAIRGEIDYFPADWSQLHLDTTLDVDSGEWPKIAVEGSLQDQQANALRAEYRKDQEQGFEYGSLQVDASFLKPFYVGYLQRYDFSGSKQLEQKLSIEYRQQCWSLLLSFSDNDRDRSVLLSFSMLGIGSVGGAGVGLGGM